MAMKKIVFILFTICLYSLTSFAQLETEWYCNQRFDLCIEYPAHFVPQGESQNGDGQLFESYDGSAYFLVYGRLYNEYDNHFDAFIYENADANITYKVIKDTYCILSGYTENGDIFYQKVKYLDDTQTTYWSMRLEYPKSQKKLFDKFCSTIANY